MYIVPRGPGYESLNIVIINTSMKEHIDLCKISKFDIIRVNIDRDRARSKFTKKCMVVRTNVQKIHYTFLSIFLFLNGCILISIDPINIKL